MQAAVLELEARPDGEILDRARDEHFAGRSLGEDTLAEMNGDSRKAVVQHLHLTRMQAGPDLDAQVSNRVPKD
jgi:hypothetical protein